MANMAARNAATASRLIRASGAPLVFRKYQPAKDKLRGQQGLELVATATSWAMLFSVGQSIERGVVAGDQVLLVDAGDLPEDLTVNWRVVLAGVEYPLVGEIEAARSSPGEPAAYFSAVVRTGSAGRG